VQAVSAGQAGQRTTTAPPQERPPSEDTPAAGPLTATQAPPGAELQAAAEPRRRRAGGLLRAPRQMAGRLSWGLADQAVSSLTNAAVSLYVVRTLGAVEFGAFSLAYVTYGFCLNASRGLATDPLMVRFSGTDLPTWRRAVRDCTGTAAVVGLVLGMVMIAASVFLPGSTRMAFLALGLTLPGLMLQDSWRYSFFALGRGSQAFVNDLAWAVLLAFALVFVRATGHDNVFYYVLAWGTTAALAASLGPVQSQVVPRLRGVWPWLSQHRDLGWRYLVEGTSGSLSTQLRTYGVGLALGLTAVASLGASTTLMGPMTILFLGMALVTLPEAARVLKRSPRHLPVFCMLVSGGLAFAGLAWGAVLLIALPRGLGADSVGHIWKAAYPLVVPQTIYVVGLSVTVGAGTGLHALGAARRSLRMNLIGSAISVALSLTGAFLGGVVWSLAGMATATWITAVYSWWQLRRAMRESGGKPFPAPVQAASKRQSGRHHRKLGESEAPVSLAESGQTIGEVLFYARRRAGMTVGELSQRTGIENAVISGIERNDYSACGGDFYARVYIRSIARVVGTDPAPLIAEFDGLPAITDQTDHLLLGTNTLALILPTEISAASRPAVSLHGRGWTRMLWAPIIVLALLAGAAGYVYHNSHSSHSAPKPGPSSTHSARPRVSPAAAPPPGSTVLQPASITAFGPGGPRHGDHPGTVFLATDGSPATAWQSNWYATARFGGLQGGTGLLLDMGRKVAVSSLQVTLGLAPGADFEVLAGDVPALVTLHQVATSSGLGGAVEVPVAHPIRARYVLIWFTRLPPDSAGTYQVAVYDLRLAGRA